MNKFTQLIHLLSHLDFLALLTSSLLCFWGLEYMTFYFTFHFNKLL